MTTPLSVGVWQGTTWQGDTSTSATSPCSGMQSVCVCVCVWCVVQNWMRLTAMNTYMYMYHIHTFKKKKKNSCTLCTTYLHMYRSDIGKEVGFEATGLVDSRLPTVSLFAKTGEVWSYCSATPTLY